ncbi:MAG: segregation/condensation protein A [Polyangiaceae bacterium]|nr:segregation/condensation protein A [Polyangiaceae bacterium]
MPEATAPQPGPAKARSRRERAPAPAERPPALAEAAPPDDVYRVQIEGFEGPLDLLLHLIRKHELDILKLPVGFITEKYLEYLSMMRWLQIDVASEYLLMAATLVHIKSRELVPSAPDDTAEEGSDEEELDPRAELVRRLLEYQKYKDAAAQLGERGALGSEVFDRGSREPTPPGAAPFAPGNVFRLFDAFDQILRRSNIRTDHQILFERVSIAERIVELTDLMHARGRMSFEDLFESARGSADGQTTRLELVGTFLALLEMCRLRLVRVVQEDSLAPIYIELAALPPSESAPTEPARAELAPAAAEAIEPAASADGAEAAPAAAEEVEPPAPADGAEHEPSAEGPGDEESDDDDDDDESDDDDDDDESDDDDDDESDDDDDDDDDESDDDDDESDDAEAEDAKAEDELTDAAGGEDAPGGGASPDDEPPSARGAPEEPAAPEALEAPEASDEPASPTTPEAGEDPGANDDDHHRHD